MQATLRLYTAMHRTLLLNSTGNRLRSVMLAKGGIFGQMMSPRLLRLGLLAIVRRACSITSFRRLDRASCSSPETCTLSLRHPCRCVAAAHLVRGVPGTPYPKRHRSKTSRSAGTAHACVGSARESACCAWR